MKSKTSADDLKALASGINHVLTMRFAGAAPEFVLIIVSPNQDEGTVTLNTITGITEPDKIAQIGRHLMDMAIAHGARALDPDDDSEIQGHA